MNQDTPRTANIVDHLATIDTVEQRRGLDFLWELPDDRENALESTVASSWVQEWVN